MCVVETDIDPMGVFLGRDKSILLVCLCVGVSSVLSSGELIQLAVNNKNAHRHTHTHTATINQLGGFMLQGIQVCLFVTPSNKNKRKRDVVSTKKDSKTSEV